MIHAFPKIFAIGTTYISSIFDNDVEITEKVDGSQFVFGKVGGELYMRSKGAQLYAENPQKMFLLGMDYVQTLDLPDDTIFYCEYLQKPHHNTLSYERHPENHLILFGVSTPGGEFVSKHELLKECANSLGIECVPLIYSGKVGNPYSLIEMLETDSVLGGQKVEGVVVKNYHQQFLVGGQPMPLMAGKFVSEKFKEIHGKTWSKEKTANGKWKTFKLAHRTDARWEKAVQHLRDAGTLDRSPRDIGSLIKEVQRDITEEEKESIKDFLWREFGQELLRTAVKGLPEWYKEKLLRDSF